MGKSIKIPVIGPIIVAVTSILAGDPIGKTLFRSIGAVFGGAIGSMGGPLGMILGEILGEFLGSFLYEMFLGEGKKKAGGSMKYLKQEFGKLISGVGKYGKMFIDFIMSQIGKFGNFLKDGFHRFIDDFPLMNIKKIKFLPSALRFASNRIPGFGGLKKFQDSGDDNKVNTFPDLSLLTVFGMKKLLAHLKNSFFPSKEKEEVSSSETAVSAGGEEEEIKEETTGAVIETPDNSDAVIDDSGESGGETTTAQLAESDTSSASSSVSNVSSQTTYEESASGTVILGEPSRSNFAPGAAGDSQYQQAMIMYNNQKEMLNSYFKTQVRASLYKI